MEVVDMDVPTPGSGHVLVRTKACGICGSDLHASEDLGRFADLASRAAGGAMALDPTGDCVFGHEFSAEIVEHGPDTTKTLPVGQLVCSVPVLLGAGGVESIGYSNKYPGGLAEYMVLQELLLLPVPESLDAHTAALTEPLAVGEHAVGLAELTGDEVCLVVGCGPVGLAVIASLKARGHGPVIAADFSPTRRKLAEMMGADVVVDPAQESPYSKWSDFGVAATSAERQGTEMFGGTARDAVIFEAVGVPGVIQTIIDGAPPKARIVVVGVCMDPDTIQPFFAITKEVQLRFAFGYNPVEFAATLTRLGEGHLPFPDLVTGTVSLEQVDDAFTTLRSPGEHGKILITY